MFINFIIKSPILTNKKSKNNNFIFIIIDYLTKIVYFKLLKITINILKLVKIIINIII